MKKVLETIQGLLDLASVLYLEFNWVVNYLRLQIQIVENWRFWVLNFVERWDRETKSFFSSSTDRS
jgi:hypothetical protein